MLRTGAAVNLSASVPSFISAHGMGGDVRLSEHGEFIFEEWRSGDEDKDKCIVGVSNEVGVQVCVEEFGQNADRHHSFDM